MKLTQLTAEPQLIRLEIKDDETVQKYGEPLEFYIYDRMSIDDFAQLMTGRGDKEYIASRIKELVLDETGKPIFQGNMSLPQNLLMKVIAEVFDTLGK